MKRDLKLTVMKMSRRAAMLGGAVAIAVAAPASSRIVRGVVPSIAPTPTTALATMSLTKKSVGNIAANQPFELGLPIAPGVMPPSGAKIRITDDAGNILPVGEDNHIVDANGDVRFMKVTSILPTAPGANSATLNVSVVGGTPSTSDPITLSNLLSQTIAADTFEGQLAITMPDGTAYTAKATDGLNASTTWVYGQPWFNGYHRRNSLCTEFVCVVPFTNVLDGTAHPYLYAEYHVMAYKADPGPWDNTTNPITGVKVYFFIWNGFNAATPGWAGGTSQNYAYDLVFTTGATNPVTQLALTGAAGSGNITLGAVSSPSKSATTALRASGNWAYSTTSPNGNDCGKALVELSGTATGIGYISQYSSVTPNKVSVYIPSTTPFSSVSVTSWKTMGVFHYYASRVSNTHPAIGGNWWGTNHDSVYPILTTDYIKASQMMPNYTLGTSQVAAPDQNAADRDGVHPCGMSVGSGRIKNYDNNEAATGDRDPIGVFPGVQVVACIYWSDPVVHATARYLMKACAEVGHRKPYYLINETYGTQNNIEDAGVYTLAGASNTGVPVTYSRSGSAWFTFGQHHSGQTDYFAYLMTGDLYHLQNMHALATDYSLRATDYAFLYGTSTNPRSQSQFAPITISSALITGDAGLLPNETGEHVQVRWTGTSPRIAGNLIGTGASNHFYYRALTGNTGNLYQTKAQAMAGGATGLVTFTTNGTGCYLVNGYNKIGAIPRANGSQTRQGAWGSRSVLQRSLLLPSNPISPNLVANGLTRDRAVRQVQSVMQYYHASYTTNASYVAGGPRFLPTQNGTNGGMFQQNYFRQSMLNAMEAGLQPSGSTLDQFLRWFMADAVQWHIRTDAYHAGYCTSYYFIVSNNLNAGGTPGYTYKDVYERTLGAPYQTVNYGGYGPLAGSFTATITSVADPANVTVTLDHPFWDMSNKTPFEGKAWVGVGATRKFGQVKTIVSSTVCVIDCTVATWYGVATGAAVPIVGSGQGVSLPKPSPGNADSVVPHADTIYYGDNRLGSGEWPYGALDRASLEIAKQLGTDTIPNYNAAVAEMVARNWPAVYPPGCIGSLVKFNLSSRV